VTKFDSHTARIAGAKGGRVSRPKKLSLERVSKELGPLDELEDAQRWLTLIARWALAGLVPGTTAHASVRAVETFLKVHESQLTREVVEDIKGEVDRLKADLKRPRIKAV
jgi:hypothetical protein